MCPTVLTTFYRLRSIIQSSIYYLSISLNPASIHTRPCVVRQSPPALIITQPHIRPQPQYKIHFPAVVLSW